jgi:hypothetical protein
MRGSRQGQSNKKNNVAHGFGVEATVHTSWGLETNQGVTDFARFDFNCITPPAGETLTKTRFVQLITSEQIQLLSGTPWSS